MKIFILSLLGVVLIVLIIIVFVIRGKARRIKQSGANDINSLKPGKAFYSVEMGIDFNAETENKVKEHLASKGFRIIENVQNGIIAYSGKSENAALKGWLNIDPMQLPIRIVCKAGANGKLLIRMDDDYGFQVLNAGQLQKFQHINEIKFKFYEDEIKKLLNVS